MHLTTGAMIAESNPKKPPKSPGNQFAHRRLSIRVERYNDLEQFQESRPVESR